MGVDGGASVFHERSQVSYAVGDDVQMWLIGRALEKIEVEALQRFVVLSVCTDHTTSSSFICLQYNTGIWHSVTSSVICAIGSIAANAGAPIFQTF